MRFLIAFIIWLILLPVMVGMKLLGFVMVPIALLFAKDRLPRIFWPWDNEEDGLEGPEWFSSRYKNKFWRRFVWLACRNMAHNFGVHVLSFKKEDISKVLEVRGNKDISDWSGVGGFYIALYKINRMPWYAFMVYIIKPLTSNHCARALFGWKIFNVDNDSSLPEAKAGFACTGHPWRKFGVNPYTETE